MKRKRLNYLIHRSASLSRCVNELLFCFVLPISGGMTFLSFLFFLVLNNKYSFCIFQILIYTTVTVFTFMFLFSIICKVILLFFLTNTKHYTKKKSIWGIIQIIVIATPFLLGFISLIYDLFRQIISKSIFL
jgi:hypothetical protein